MRLSTPFLLALSLLLVASGASGARAAGVQQQPHPARGPPRLAARLRLPRQLCVLAMLHDICACLLLTHTISIHTAAQAAPRLSIDGTATYWMQRQLFRRQRRQRQVLLRQRLPPPLQAQPSSKPWLTRVSGAANVLLPLGTLKCRGGPGYRWQTIAHELLW